MADFRRQRGNSPRQQSQFGSKVVNSLSTRRGAREEWDAGRRDPAAPRANGFPGQRRARTGWDTVATRTKSPPVADIRQDGAESDDDIAAKPRTQPPATASLASAAGTSRAPAHAQPASHTAPGAAFFKGGTAAPPPDLVRPAYDPEEDVASVTAKKASGFDLYPIRHHNQEKHKIQLDVPTASRSRVRAPVPETTSPPPVKPLPQHRPPTPPMAPAAPTSAAPPALELQREHAKDPTNGAALELSSSVAGLSDKVDAMQSSFKTHVKDMEALQSTTLSHSSLIAALQQRLSCVVDQTKSLGGQVTQLETAHGKRLADVETAQAQAQAQPQAAPSTTHAATDIQTDARETVGDTQVQGLQPNVYIKSERNGQFEGEATATDRPAQDSRVDADAASPNAMADMTPTSPTLRPNPSSTLPESRPSQAGLNGSMNGVLAADQAATAAAHAGKRPSATASDSEASAGIVRIMRAFQEKLLDVDQRYAQLAARCDAPCGPADPQATASGVLDSAAAVVQDAWEAVTEQRDAQASYEKRMKRFVQDMERMMKTLQDQLMGADHYMQLLTARVDQIAGDCLYHRDLLRSLDTSRAELQEKQDELGRRGTELSATVNKLQQQQQSLTIQVQKAEAERLKEARRAKEAAKATPPEQPAPGPAPVADQLQQQERVERERKAAEARASEAVAVKELQQENTALKGRIAALETILTKDGLQGLIQDALAAEGKAAGGKAEVGKSAGNDGGKSSKATTPAVSAGDSGSSGSPSQDGTVADASIEEPDSPPKKPKKKVAAPKKRKRTADTDEGPVGSSGEKKAKPGKRTRGKRGST